MPSEVRWVGIDAHKDTLSLAVLEGGAPKAMECKSTHNEATVKRLVRRRTGDGGEVRACYEAGPTGYELQRTLERGGIVCDVVAPGLVPHKAGDRMKTDRRDALNLARLLRAGMLTEVRPPSSAEEAVRDLCRTRHTVTQDLTRCRNRLKMFLLRRNRVAPGPSHWTRGHHEWLTVVAMTIVTELHGFERFRSPRALMAFLGLVPSEASSGAKQRRGAITKTGNSFVRRVLVEASHHCSKPPRVGLVVQRRRAGQPAEVVAIAERAQHRLHRRFWRLVSTGKPRNKALVAVAREFAGFVWAVLYLQNSPRAEVDQAVVAWTRRENYSRNAQAEFHGGRTRSNRPDGYAIFLGGWRPRHPDPRL